MTLPAPLQPLAAYNQWITYGIRPSQTRPGKTDKIPTDWRTGEVCSAFDPIIQTDYATAVQAIGGHVGFVLADTDPFFCIDIDNCLVDGAWSPLALEVMGALPGAAWEVSVSGNGLHGWGMAILPTGHGTRAPGLELYSTGRFVAVTGVNAVGDAACDLTMPMQAVVDKYFGVTSGAPATWTTGPVEI